ncbi:hypothetical protein OHB26_27295 [Nocardia sp. NBC_01503]|nr:sigma factor [Nocardia sp. NBC_01503]WTL30617.1 hypothetical protein OHB26_27295 [Nocardia sp. NBC_01503]
MRVPRRDTAAAEITQEVYLYVWNAATHYDERLASPIGWPMMRTHRRAVDRVRLELRIREGLKRLRTCLAGSMNDA